MMSIGLSRIVATVAQTTAPRIAPTSQGVPPGADPRWLDWLFAVGLCTLVVWIVRRAAYPRKLTLRNTPGRPNTLTPFHVMGVLAIWCGFLLVMHELLGERADPSQVVVTAANQAALLAVSLVAARFTFRHGLRRGLGLSMRHWVFDTGRGIVGYLAVLPICLLLFWMIPRTQDDTHPVLKMLMRPDLSVWWWWWWKTATILSVVVLTPVAEEVFFRGLIQSTFRRYFRSPWVGIVATSAIFALVHYPQWKDMPALFALAVALGYNYERCGRLYPAILIHVIFNAVNIAVVLTG